MYFENLDIIAPSKTGKKFNEAEVLGSAVWLWMQSDTHKEIPLMDLPTILLPAIKHGQFVLAIEKGKPVFFLSWAEMNEAAEARYLDSPPELMPLDDWHCGDRIWFLDWLAPFGHTHKLTQFLQKVLFADRCVRSLYHRGDAKGLRVQTFHGRLISQQLASEWFSEHPISASETYQIDEQSKLKPYATAVSSN